MKTMLQIMRRKRQYIEVIEPFIKQKIRIISLLPHQMLLIKGEMSPMSPIHTPESLKMIKQLDELIELTRREYLET